MYTYKTIKGISEEKIQQACKIVSIKSNGAALVSAIEKAPTAFEFLVIVNHAAIKPGTIVSALVEGTVNSVIAHASL